MPPHPDCCAIRPLPARRGEVWCAQTSTFSRRGQRPSSCQLRRTKSARRVGQRHAPRAVPRVHRRTHPIARASLHFVPLNPPYQSRQQQKKKGSGTPKDASSNLCARRRHVYAVGANHLPGTARARQSALACRRPATALTCGALAPWAQLQARLPGTRTRNGIRRAGVTRPFLSQSSGCTPHTGRSTGEHDARSRSGAVCKSARKHRPRSVFGCASRTRPSSERDEGARNYTEDACQGFCPIKRDVSARSIAFPLS